jgi:DDE domain
MRGEPPVRSRRLSYRPLHRSKFIDSGGCVPERLHLPRALSQESGSSESDGQGSMSDGSTLVSPASLPGCDHPPGGLALPALHAELPGRGGSTCRARARHLLRNGAALVLKFGPLIARKLRQRRPRPSNRWHLDEMVIRNRGQADVSVARRRPRGRDPRYARSAPRDKRAALRLMRKLLKKQGFAPKLLVTDKLRPYGSAFRHLRLTCPHEKGLRSNNRAENSHQVVIALTEKIP